MSTAKEITRGRILNAALICARRHGLYTMTRDGVAARAKVAQGTISFHFGTMQKLREEVIRETIKRRRYLDVLAQAISRGDRIAMRAPAEIRRQALDALV